jgi:polyphenol oxidase
MIRKSNGSTQWLEFELFQAFEGLKHAVFLRHGGVSQGAYNSLNLSSTMGDNPAHVEENLNRAKSALSLEHLASALQVHGDGIEAVNLENYHTLATYDALMTQIPNLGLKISHADCQAAIFYDPIQHVVATVHCGWRGHVCEIYRKTIAAMGRTYGSKPTDIHVAIAPSLGPQHAEFVNYRTEFPEPFWQFQVSNNHFDLWALATWQLNQCGILSPHIQLAEICTYANHEDCFSYRRSQRVTGAHGTVAALEKRGL